MISGSPSSVDIAVLVALEEEWDEFLDLLPCRRVVPDDTHGGYYFEFEAGPPGARIRCVSRLIAEKSPGPAALATERVISRWNPGTVVILGIAASIHDDLKLGDVAVAEQIDAYLSEVRADGGGFQHRGKVFA